ncbi:MAG TPA: hypothetical protein VJN96_05090 [Vicinamibacterales bacterium]|nr:hypothetical protein [Vicinamibacterales bacterium]
MSRPISSIALLLLLLSAAPLAMAQFVFRVGDSVYVDGHKYTWDDWQKIRDHYQPPSSSAAPTAVAEARPDASTSNGPRAASCISSIYYDVFPADDERFSCTEGLGALTREEILRQGWKVDFVDKVPAPAGQQSPRGLPLYQYKLVISR